MTLETQKIVEGIFLKRFGFSFIPEEMGDKLLANWTEEECTYLFEETAFAKIKFGATICAQEEGVLTVTQINEITPL